MPSKQNGTSTPPEPPDPSGRPNAFNRLFLTRLDERDEPPLAGEADTAGPWQILEVPGRGFGLFREGEDPARGYRPYAVFPDRWLALIAAAVLPGTGRDPFVHLADQPGAEGFAFLLDDGEAVGHCENFDQPFCDGIHAVVSILRAPVARRRVGGRRLDHPRPLGRDPRRPGRRRGGRLVTPACRSKMGVVEATPIASPRR